MVRGGCWSRKCAHRCVPGDYALAALLAAVIQVIAEVNGRFLRLAPRVAIATCLVLRLLAVRYSWALPVAGRR